MSTKISEKKTLWIEPLKRANPKKRRPNKFMTNFTSQMSTVRDSSVIHDMVGWGSNLHLDLFVATKCTVCDRENSYPGKPHLRFTALGGSQWSQSFSSQEHQTWCCWNYQGNQNAWCRRSMLVLFFVGSGLVLVVWLWVQVCMYWFGAVRWNFEHEVSMKGFQIT